MIEAIVISSFLFIFYTYFGYPVVLWRLAARRHKTTEATPAYNPTVTVVIAAYNEEKTIGGAIGSILASDYPQDLLNVIVVSDVSTDRTDEIVQFFDPERVQLLRQTTRSGQSASLQRGAQAARGDILVLADASGRFFPDTVRRLATPFADPHVGGVSGHKVIRATGTAVSKGDGVYLRYDTALRNLESMTGSSWVGCQGGLFAIRRRLFTVDYPLGIAADNATCYELYERGYQHLFDPAAKVTEPPSGTLRTEFARKIRIIVLGIHGLFHFRHLFVPWRHPGFVFQNLSHKVFRWLVPFALITMWVASGMSDATWARLFFILQCGFYGLAVAGGIYGKFHRFTPRIYSIPAYFTAVNLAGLLAWFALKRQYAVWTPPAR